MAPLASQPGLTVTQGLQLPTPKLLPPKSQLAEQWDNVGRELGKLGGGLGWERPGRPGIWGVQCGMDHLSLPSKPFADSVLRSEVQVTSFCIKKYKFTSDQESS